MIFSEPWLLSRTFEDAGEFIAVHEVYDLTHPKCPVVHLDKTAFQYGRTVFLRREQFSRIFGTCVGSTRASGALRVERKNACNIPRCCVR